MNILHTESSMNWGGQEFRTLLENIYLGNHGHQSWIMCHPDSMLYQKAQLLGGQVIACDLRKSLNFKTAFNIFSFCKKHKVDIINSHGSRDSYLCFLSYRLGIPLVRSRQNTNLIKNIFSYKYCCSHILATAKVIKKQLINIGVNADKITVIGEGVDLNDYHPRIDADHLRKEFNISKNDKVVINIGMIRGDKGQEYFIKAAKILLQNNDKIKFFLIGESTEDKCLESRLKKMIKDYRIENHFVFTGYREDIPEFVALADLVVITSLWTEAQSRIAPQAFATGKTVVASNAGGLTELVLHENTGLIVPPKNAEQIANSIERILTDNYLKQKLEKNALNFAIAHLSFDNMMDKTISLYNKVRPQQSKK